MKDCLDIADNPDNASKGKRFKKKIQASTFKDADEKKSAPKKTAAKKTATKKAAVKKKASKK